MSFRFVRADERRGAPSRRPSRLAVLATLALLVPVHPALAEDPPAPTIVRIEEDWVVNVNIPDPDGHAPQIINVISPDDTQQVHAVFECNHSTQPDYSAGGMQLQCWLNDDVVDWSTYPFQGLLSTPSETITYTLRMELKEGKIVFAVRNGTSTTWGTFGTYGYFKTSVSSSLQNLNDYHPDDSVSSSRIGFASHRVQKFALKEVRVYTSGGLYGTDTTERIVHEHSAN